MVKYSNEECNGRNDSILWLRGHRAEQCILKGDFDGKHNFIISRPITKKIQSGRGM
jgi:hypothetical protein